MESIPLTRVRHASNFVFALEEKGEPLYGQPMERLLEGAKLPADLLHGIGDDGIISAVSMLEFAETAAHQTGILDLGFWAGKMPVEDYGDFGKRVICAPSLHGAIKTFCDEVRSECSTADYYLTHNRLSAWFCHGPVGVPPIRQSQHELYALMIIIQVIQLALGKRWKPSRIRLQTIDESCARDNHYLLDTNIEFGAPVTAVEIPLNSLATPLKNAAKRTCKMNSVDIAENFSENPIAALKDLIAQQTWQSKQPSIELAAELAGVGKRTLQRYLSNNATSYRQLMDQVKYEIALPLLQDRSNSVTTISRELGYSDIAHFSRAFKRISGMSPRMYRKMLDK